MDPNVWFDDACIIKQACSEDVIDHGTKDALLHLNKVYQRAKHRNDFSAEDDETKGFDVQIGTLKQAEGHSHVIVKADASRTSIKVGEVANGTTCIIDRQATHAKACRIHVETPDMKLIGWVRQENVCNIRTKGTSASASTASEANAAIHPASEKAPGVIRR